MSESRTPGRQTIGSTPIALTIAGSDSSGGAGIQADLKTMTALGVYGASVLTAVTAQNTLGVQGIHPVPIEMVEAQLRSVLDDLTVSAVKIGMLGDEALIDVVADALATVPAPVVLDPVMVATSGDVLVPASSVEVMRRRLIDGAALITPNLPEASFLTGLEVRTEHDMIEVAHRLIDDGAAAVLVKGGHLDDDAVVDVLVDSAADDVVRFEHRRVDTPHTHGTGCTLSSAIAAHLATGVGLVRAVEFAIDFVAQAIESGRHGGVGRGHGPVDHLVRIRG